MESGTVLHLGDDDVRGGCASGKRALSARPFIKGLTLVGGLFSSSIEVEFVASSAQEVIGFSIPFCMWMVSLEQALHNRQAANRISYCHRQAPPPRDFNVNSYVSHFVSPEHENNTEEIRENRHLTPPPQRGENERQT